MTQPDQEPTLGDLVLRDLETQFAVDARYAAKCRELALVRGQYQQLMSFVQSKADVLGLESVDASTSVSQPLVKDSETEDAVPDKAKLSSVSNTN